jgi:hypothetical protein
MRLNFKRKAAKEQRRKVKISLAPLILGVPAGLSPIFEEQLAAARHRF